MQTKTNAPNLASRKPKPVSPAPQMSRVYIGNTQHDTSPIDIQAHMKIYSKLGVELKDIQEISTKGNRKAFKVSVPQNKVQSAISGWPSRIKAEPFASLKSKGPPRRHAKMQGNGRR